MFVGVPAGGCFGGGNQGPAVLPGDYTVKVNAIISGDIAAINDAMKAAPRIAVEPIK